MLLILTNGYPHPYPENLSQAEQDEIANNTTSITVKGVKNFEMKHTITIEFLTQAAYEQAQLVTGWVPYCPGVLEAPHYPDEGYDFTAIGAGAHAYCGWILADDHE